MRPSGALPPPSPPSRLSGLFSFEFCASTRAAARFARFSRRRSDPTDFWPAVSFFPSLSFLFLRSLLFPLSSFLFPLSSCLCLCLCLFLFLISVDCSSLFVNGCFCFARPSRRVRGSVGSRVRSRRCRMEGRGAPSFRRPLGAVRSRLPKFWLAFCGGLLPRLSPPAPPLAQKVGNRVLIRAALTSDFALPRPIDSPPPIAFRFAGSLVDLSPPLFLPFFLSVFPSGFFPASLAGSGLAVIFACAASAVSFFFDSLGPLAPFRPLARAAGSRRPKAPGAGAAKVCLKLSKGE